MCCGLVYERFALHDPGGSILGHAGLERGEAHLDELLDVLGSGTSLVDSDAIAGRTAEQLVDWHPQRLAREVPKRLLDAAQGAGK